MPPKGKKNLKKVKDDISADTTDDNIDNTKDKGKKVKKEKKDKKDKNKKDKNIESNSDSESDQSDQSNQSDLSDTEYPQKGAAAEKIIEVEKDEDDNLVDYDEDAEEADEDEKEGEKEGEDEDEQEDEQEDEKESIAKNEDMKDDDDDECVYRSAKKKNMFEDDDDDGEDNFFDDDVETKNVYVSDKDRITTRKLTKYERVNIIGTRAKQIELGAQKMVKNTKGLNPKQIAKLELEMKLCPIIIKRVLPSGAIELIDVNTLDIRN